MPKTAPKLTPDQHAEATLREAGWWARADIHETYPVSDTDVVALLKANEYDIDPERLERLLEQGHFPPPRTINGKRHWLARDVIQLAGLLECRRQWRAFSRLHDAKKSPYQRSLEEAELTGDVDRLVKDLGKFDVHHLLILMAAADNREVREQLLVSLQVKLKDEGFDCGR